MEFFKSRDKRLFMISLSWCCILTSCRILRLSCKTESNFSVVSKDSKLLNHVLKTSTVTSVAQCFAECEGHKDCKSVNHAETSSLNCQLNSKVKQEIPSANFATASPGWTYYATNYSNSNNIGSYCELFSPCAQNQYCMDSCSCPAYQCFNSTNLAYKKPAVASSTWDADTLAPNAVDGNLSGAHKHCVLTKNTDPKQWWYVDLQKRAVVFYVKVKNRSHGCCYTRGSPFDVRVGDKKEDAAATNDFCVQQQSFPNYEVFKRFDCLSEVSGQFVSFHSKLNSHMDLCELEVYGYYL